jgi:hypothetical protein
MAIPSSGTILVDEEGIRWCGRRRGWFLRRNPIEWQVRWADIVKISIWKVDAYVYDIICMGFWVDGSETYRCCDEQSDGWNNLQSQLLSRYRLKIEDWWDAVVLPPFVENFTVVWQR